MKKKHLFYLITLASILLFAILQLLDNPMIQEKVEGRTFDLRLNLRDLAKYQQPPEDIVIITVDEKSIREIGRWPWRRDVMAILVHKISEDRPKVIGIDIIFSFSSGLENCTRHRYEGHGSLRRLGDNAR